MSKIVHLRVGATPWLRASVNPARRKTDHGRNACGADFTPEDLLRRDFIATVKDKDRGAKWCEDRLICALCRTIAEGA